MTTRDRPADPVRASTPAPARLNACGEEEQLYRRFEFLVNAPALFNAVATGVELDVFGFLAGTPGGATAEELGEFTGLDQHPLRVLLQAICASGLLNRHDGKYVNSVVADRLLAPQTPDSWGHILLGWKEIYYPAFAELTQALRAGTNTALDRFPGAEPTLYERLASQPELEAVFHRAMGAFTLRSLPDLLAHLDLSGVRRLFDAGGGDGVTAAHLLERHPTLTVTISDLPTVARLAEASLSRFGSRVSIHHGDLFADGFPGGADAVLFSHVLEIYSGEQIRTLLAKAYASLPPGGKVFIYGFNVSDDETEGLYSARLSLYLNVLASGQGMAYPAHDYEDWLRRAGFVRVGTIRGLAYEHGLTMGVRS